MVAVPELLRFYVDESAAGLGLALAAARKDTVHVGHPLIPECPRGALDTEWIPAVAKRDLIVITRDKKLRTKPVEVQALWEHRLRVFNIGGKTDLSTWEWLARVVRHWDRMEEILSERPRGPRQAVHSASPATASASRAKTQSVAALSSSAYHCGNKTLAGTTGTSAATARSAQAPLLAIGRP